MGRPTLLIVRWDSDYSLTRLSRTGGFDLLGGTELQETVQGRMHHSNVIAGTAGLGEDVLDASSLKHGANGTTGDEAGTGRSWLKEDLAAVGNTHDIMRDRVALELYGNEVLLGVLGALFDSIGNLVGFAVTDTNATFFVTNDAKCGEAEATTTLNDLGATVNENDLFNQLVTVLVVGLRNLARTAIFPAGRTLLLITSGSYRRNSAHRLECETTFASGICEDFNFTVVESAAAIKHNGGDTGGLGLSGESCTKGLGTGDVGGEL